MSDFTGCGTDARVIVAHPGAAILREVNENYDPNTDGRDYGLVIGDKGSTGIVVAARSLDELLTFADKVRDKVKAAIAEKLAEDYANRN